MVQISRSSGSYPILQSINQSILSSCPACHTVVQISRSSVSYPILQSQDGQSINNWLSCFVLHYPRQIFEMYIWTIWVHLASIQSCRKAAVGKGDGPDANTSPATVQCTVYIRRNEAFLTVVFSLLSSLASKCCTVDCLPYTLSTVFCFVLLNCTLQQFPDTHPYRFTTSHDTVQ